MDVTIWGSIAANGTISSGSRDPDGDDYNFTVTHNSTGEYGITFKGNFIAMPAVVGSQNNYGQEDSESPLDNIVFPVVGTDSAIAVVGDASGKRQDRSFAFIAIGHGDTDDA
jgi:hypothetical protein